jgi:hypothetical protein
VLHAIREEMSREADYDVDLFAEMVRSGVQPSHGPQRVIRGFSPTLPIKSQIFIMCRALSSHTTGGTNSCGGSSLPHNVHRIV